MVVLLATSTLAAALVPAPPPQEETTDTTPPRTSSVPSGGELIEAKLDANAGRPKRVRASLGDQVDLLVRSRKPAQIEIRGLGLLEDVLPLSPARFSVLATRPGRFEIHRVDPPQTIGVLEVAREGSS